MNTIGVIGIGGVGMAHICAAVRSNIQIKYLIDINDTILNNAIASNTWVNRWGDIVEEVQKTDSVIYSKSLNIAKTISVDLIILATPPHTHIDIITDLYPYTQKLLCEKPCSISNYFNDIDNKIIMSTEWPYHKKIVNYNHISYLGMNFLPSKTTVWEYPFPASLDFLPHLFSILIHKKYKIQDITCKYHNNDGFLFNAKTNKGDVILQGFRNSEKPLGLYINNDILNWQNDLFDIQFNNVETIGISWNLMQELECKIRKFL